MCLAPAAHQQQALDNLNKWFMSTKKQAGGILVLPTGGGKTFTAMHFLCRHPISDNYKILWLAHTHHLLEQAFSGMDKLLCLIAEPKNSLNVRLVSGTIGHFKVADIKQSDDVVVATVQTIWNAMKNNHPAIDSFLENGIRPIFIVIDEAHHSPAPSYRQLISYVNDKVDNVKILGLTATPTYSDKTRRGWLAKLFPQGIIHQIRAEELMASGVLAKPIIETTRTNIEARFDDREFEKWVSTNQDIPEDIIGSLAENQERNHLIVETYVKNKERFGKTLIFADRWFQCEYIREALRRRGVKADAVYTHIDTDPGSVAARNRRNSDENAKILQSFRDNQLDVLINVRMLTEGTDVPNVQSVFLTRQTTSQILLTQMVGRALRGPKFGGTAEANIVSFIDNWEHNISWAEFGQLSLDGIEDVMPEYGKRPPLELISIDLVRDLARQMDSGVNVAPLPFQLMLPKGWYRVEYHVQLKDSDDFEPKTRLLMVFEHEYASYQKIIKKLQQDDLNAFSSENCALEGIALDKVSKYGKLFFTDIDIRAADELKRNLFDLARHVAQNDKQTPKFFKFEERELHDLDKLAQGVIINKLSLVEIYESAHAEYARTDLYWRVIYPNFDMFKSQLDACVNRLLKGHIKDSPIENSYTTPEKPVEREPSEELKCEILARDSNRCLCCGYNLSRRYLQIDHIAPFYLKGDNSPSNLQTLCRQCNQEKAITVINFRKFSTTLTGPLAALPRGATPGNKNANDRRWWEFYLRRTINAFYQCAAVNNISIKLRGKDVGIWRIILNPGNPPSWLQAHLQELNRIIRRGGGLGEKLEQVVIDN